MTQQGETCRSVTRCPCKQNLTRLPKNTEGFRLKRLEETLPCVPLSPHKFILKATEGTHRCPALAERQLRPRVHLRDLVDRPAHRRVLVVVFDDAAPAGGAKGGSGRGCHIEGAPLVASELLRRQRTPNFCETLGVPAPGTARGLSRTTYRVNS